MAKSKEQKRKEAIQRFRMNYSAESKLWQKSQPGGELYEETKKESGFETANRFKHAADRKFATYLLNAKLDSHGNMVPEHHIPSLFEIMEIGSLPISVADARILIASHEHSKPPNAALIKAFAKHEMRIIDEGTYAGLGMGDSAISRKLENQSTLSGTDQRTREFELHSFDIINPDNLK